MINITSVKNIFSENVTKTSGKGFISGSLRNKGVAYGESFVSLVAEMSSIVAVKKCNNDGTYNFARINPLLSYTVIAYDARKKLNAVIADRVKPELLQ